MTKPTRVPARIFGFVTGMILLGLSLFFCELGFDRIIKFRELERIPLSAIADSVGGESQLRGKSIAGDRILKSPFTKTESLYFRYLLEEEVRDSDGDTKWRTVRDESRYSNFFIEDESGRAEILANRGASLITFSVAQKVSMEKGKFRHTEWRIDPGDKVTVFGWLSYQPDAVVGFIEAGKYQPIISSFSGGEERSRIALGAILWLWGGVSVLILACFAFVTAFRVHKILTFLLIVSSATSLLLFTYSYRSGESDVREGYDRVVDHWQRADKLITKRLESHGLLPIGLVSPFDLASLAYAELSEVEKRKIDAWRLSAVQVRARYLSQITRYPERVIASGKGLDQPPDVALPPVLQPVAEQMLADYLSTRITNPVFTVVLVLVIVFLAPLIVWFSIRSIRLKRMMENIPTSKSTGMVYGLSELKGALIADDPNKVLRGPLTNESCTWYHYLVKEKRRDSDGDTKWVTIKDETRKQPFLCEDDEGSLRVFPSQAEIITSHKEVEERGDYQYTERRLSPGDDLYILGKAKQNRARGDTLIFGYEKGSPFIISNVPEEEVMMDKAFSGMGLLTFALSGVFLATIFIFGASGQLSSLDFMLAAMVAPVFMLIVVFILMYNDLIFLQQRCDRNWANIQVSLKKRSQLVPQLESVVKEYLEHEKSLQEHLAELRSLRNSASTSRDIDEYMSKEHLVIDEVQASIEAYPDLKGIDLVEAFSKRLIRLENEIAMIRAGFNDSVEHYETRRQSFPDNVLAGLARLTPRDLLHYTERAHQVA